MAFTPAHLTERKVITDLLLQYQHHPCLWNNNDPLYGKSDAKKQALSDMLDTYKLITPDATMELLKKKIENLRSAYRRERKKVLNDRRHKPCLWYYNLMTFLDEGTTVAEYHTVPQSETEDEEDVSGIAERTSQFCEILNSDMKIEPFHPEESTYTIKTNQQSEPDAFGRALGLQLSELTVMQKTIAEKLISDVVYYARLDKLTTKTNLVNLSDDYL